MTTSLFLLLAYFVPMGFNTVGLIGYSLAMKTKHLTIEDVLIAFVVVSIPLFNAFMTLCMITDACTILKKYIAKKWHGVRDIVVRWGED